VRRGRPPLWSGGSGAGDASPRARSHALPCQPASAHTHTRPTACPPHARAAPAADSLQQEAAAAAQQQLYEEEEDEEEEAIQAQYPRESSPQLLSFLAKYDSLRPEQLAGERDRLGFRRGADGRVALRSRGGEWFAVKPDMQAPGFLLLRDAEGYCFYIPPADDGAPRRARAALLALAL
jgi:hypothetical protein